MAEPAPARLQRATEVAVLLFTWGVLLSYYPPSLLLLDTTIAGGDTPSFVRPVTHLKEVLLPAGQPLGFDLANFAGYAPYQFYFLPPALAIVGLSSLLPFNVAFKLVTVLGVFLLPLSALLALRALRQPHPVPALGSAAMLLFLLNEGNSMWGGNIPSTLAGEFAHSIAFSLGLLFLGRLYRGVEQQRGWRSLAVLLAATGLCHPVAFLNAGLPGAFFLLGRRGFVGNLRFLLQVYGGAVLLMGFWLLPLLAKLRHATSINWTWSFASAWDLLPPILYPVAGLAALDAAWILWRRTEDTRPARYVLFAAAVSAVLFVNATELGLPEIRFIPFVYLAALLLALDALRRLLPLHVASPVAAAGLALCLAAWAQAHVQYIPAWIRWNYQGLEGKPAWPLLQRLSAAVAGRISDPRVAYEHSPQHEPFGSMRIFEDMALLSGRPTLEGVLLQTSLQSPFVYWLQSQVSKQGTGVIPGYPYPVLDLGRATPRLALYNVQDFIAVTPEVKGALEADPRWRRTFAEGGYAVFHLQAGDPHYVRVPRFRPALLDSVRWKWDFHRWFRSDAALEVPLVLAATVPEGDRAAFTRTDSPAEPPREPMPADCRVEEAVAHLEIAFTTTCPGVPHTVAVSWFPNWRVAEGAAGVALSSPGFMAVVPRASRVRLVYARVAVDWLGLFATGAGVLLLAAPWRIVAREVAPGPLAARLTRAQPALVGGALAVVLLATAWNGARHLLGPRLYQRGWAAFGARDYAAAERLFSLAARVAGPTPTGADATFFLAASLYRQQRLAEALPLYQQVVDRFPASPWVAESHVHAAYCLRGLSRPAEARARLEWVVREYPGDRWAGLAQEELERLAGQ